MRRPGSARRAGGCVYEIRNTVNDKRYIGVTVFTPRRRWRQHVCTAFNAAEPGVFQRAIRKYGEDAFEISVRAMLPTYGEALLAERIAIALERPAYNMAAGGRGAVGMKASAKTRARMRAAKLGKICSDEARANMSAAQRIRTDLADRARKVHTGRKRSPETCARISAAKAGKPRTAAQDAASLAHRKYRHSAETCAKISGILKQSPASAAHMKRLHTEAVGKKKSTETRAKMSASAKAARARRG